MKTVLGLSITRSRVGWVLVDAAAPGDRALDDDAFNIGDGDSVAERGAAAACSAQAIAIASGHEVRSVGVAWCGDVEADATALIELLRDRGFDDVRAVPREELDDADCAGLDPLEAAYRAADAVATGTVPRFCAVQELCSRPSGRTVVVKLAAAALAMIALLGAGALVLTRDALPSRHQADPGPIGQPQIVSAHIASAPTHLPQSHSPTAAVIAQSKRTREAVVAPEPSQVIVAAAPTPAPTPTAEAAPITDAHLPVADLPGPLVPGPVTAAAQPVVAAPATAPAPVSEPTQFHADGPADPVAVLFGALP